ncbi:MAG: transcription termination factor Rho, partial [Actinomycetota bacterium]|nr:transcription termination factor Rho [Actinomycetota bacterium]
MSDTTNVLDAPASASGDSTADGGPGKAKRRASGLSGMVLAELQGVASDLGITGTGRMRKGQLIEAIQERQGGGASNGAQPDRADSAAAPPRRQPRDRGASATPDTGEQQTDSHDDAVAAPERTSESTRRERRPQRDGAEAPSQSGRQQVDRQQGDRQQGDRQQGDRAPRDRQQAGQPQGDRQPGVRPREDEDDLDGRGGRSRRRGRYRDRNRSRRGGRDGFTPDEPEPEINEDDVLVPVAGILDILDSYAFVRTSGYLPGPNDVYVSLAQVRKSGLRKGDAITGAVKQPREGERKEKFNALVRLDSVNGADPEKSRGRVEFGKLTPLYPQDRLRLETEPSILTTRVIDLVA